MRAVFAVVSLVCASPTTFQWDQHGMQIPQPLEAPDPAREANYQRLGGRLAIDKLNFGKSETEGSLETMINRMEKQKAIAGGSQYFDSDLSTDEVEKLSEMVNTAKEKEAEEEMKAESDKEAAQRTLSETQKIETKQAEVLQSNNALGGLFNAAVHSYNQHVFTKNQLASETKKSGLLQAFLAGDESDFATAISNSNAVIQDIGGLITQVADLADGTQEDTQTVNDLFEWDTDCTTNLNALVTQTKDLARRIKDLESSLQVSMDQTTEMNRDLADRIAHSKAPPITPEVEDKDAVKSAQDMSESLMQIKEKDALLKAHPDYHAWSFGEKFQHLFTQLKVQSGGMVQHTEDVIHASEAHAKSAVEGLEKRIKMYSRVLNGALAAIPAEALSPIQHA